MEQTDNDFDNEELKAEKDKLTQSMATPSKSKNSMHQNPDISKETFLKFDPAKIVIEIVKTESKFWSSQEYVIEVKVPGFVGKISKRYNDFLAFNEALQTKFKNLVFPEFPSKFQFIKKKETRRDK